MATNNIRFFKAFFLEKNLENKIIYEDVDMTSLN